MLPYAFPDSDRARDKMPWYLRVLPRFAQKLAMRYCTQPVLLVLAILIFLVILPLALRDQIDEASRGINGIYAIDPSYKYLVSSRPANPWLELSLTYRQQALTDFTPYLPERDTKCINRSAYAFEYSRLMGIHPYRDVFSQPHVLLVGDSTDLGVAIWRSLNASGYRVAHTGCQHSIDWSATDTAVIIEKVNITHGFVACPMALPKFASSNGVPWGKGFHSSYLKGFGRLMAQKRAPFTYVASSPIEGEHEAIVWQAGGAVVEAPLLLSPNNIVGNAVRECKKAGRSTIEMLDNETISDITADDVADFLVRSIDGPLPQRVQIVGTKTNSLRTTIEAAVAGVRCDLTFQPSPHFHEVSEIPKTIVKLVGNPNAIGDFVKQEFAVKTREPYVSIVVVGRSDADGFEQRAQHFLDSIGNGLTRAPLADIELVFIDYATPAGQPPLHEAFKLPVQLKGRVRFVQVPIEKHRELQKKYNSTVPFFEHIAKNIGIRRARGRFILSTNPDNLFPSNLFELIAAEDFNDGVLYRAGRWYHPSDNGTAEIWQAMGEPWRLQELGVKMKCSIGDDRFTVNDGVKKFLGQAYPCGAGDFLLASRQLWDTVWGFSEMPSNPHADATLLAKFMKLIPGYARFFIHPVILHQGHEKNVRDQAAQDVDAVIAEIACFGTSKTLGNNWDLHKWGQAGEAFAETVL
jgi:hypothetical protein